MAGSTAGREWLTKPAGICQCCAQGKDAKRPKERQRCCALRECCEAYPSRRVVQAARDALRAALTHAVTEEEISKNVASLVKVPKPLRLRIKPWSVVEAGRFLSDALTREDPTWKSIDFETGELYVDHRIQRAGRQILHRETKTEESDDFLPLPEFCLNALRMRRAQQTGDRTAAGDLRQDTRAHTCSSLLVALKVHPKVAQRILRHSQIAMTMEVYAEASEEEVRAALGKLSEAMGGAG